MAKIAVAPLVGAWIEIRQANITYRFKRTVAPLVGAWIEIYRNLHLLHDSGVAPLVGAWIEIFGNAQVYREYESLPSWERGLKSLSCYS